MSNNLNNSPVADFDWEAFEKGESHGAKSREELTKTYDESLGQVKSQEVIEGTRVYAKNAVGNEKRGDKEPDCQ